MLFDCICLLFRLYPLFLLLFELHVIKGGGDDPRLDCPLQLYGMLIALIKFYFLVILA
jgi:hypothetical protein